jgi:predicted Zn-dependent protease
MSKKRNSQLPKNPKPDAGQDTGTAAGRAERVRWLVGEGARLLAAKRPGEAAPLLVQAREQDPQNAAAAINLAGAYILQGKHDLAVPVLEAAARLEPDNPMVWTNLAAAYLGKLPFATQERQERAIEAYEKALILEPRTPHVHYTLGLIFLERNDKARASVHFHRALGTDPTDRDAQHWLEVIRRGEETGQKLQE